VRTQFGLKLEGGRVRDGHWASKHGDQHGAFSIMGPAGAVLTILSSGVDHENGWEHVSVSVNHRTPNWREMTFVKDSFWGDEEMVVQFHPPKSAYVTCHPTCLPLFRPVDGNFPMPPSHLVGPKGRSHHGR